MARLLHLGVLALARRLETPPSTSGRNAVAVLNNKDPHLGQCTPQTTHLEVKERSVTLVKENHQFRNVQGQSLRLEHIARVMAQRQANASKCTVEDTPSSHGAPAGTDAGW
ncbi:hypothetical protein B0H14DRAFT_2555820 [Mycena olivaceomarginata]|nr:hypothetical protein B0H14DRAFT_2555820 [Mycena olivaceomarginata]